MGFICPNTSNQGNWDPGTATELRLSPAAGGNHLVRMCIDTYILSLADHPAHPRRGAGWGCWWFLCFYECWMYLSWSVQSTIYIYMVNVGALYECAYWEYMLSLTTICTWEYGAAAASPLSGHWIWPNIFSLIMCTCLHMWLWSRALPLIWLLRYNQVKAQKCY